jgi:putative hydrolase of the HAD superfamily
VSKITAVFCDVGGVILTNGWDRESRCAAELTFALDSAEFEDRHELAFPAFEVGRTSIQDYVERTVFYRKRSFSPEQFINFMYAQSHELPESRLVADRIARAGKCLVAALNNEGAELNAYRIATFDLRRTFSVFFSSCYTGTRKPDAPIYRTAMNITQRKPEECLFVDDREANLEAPRTLGMNTILFQSATQWEDDLRKLGVDLAPK